MDTSEIFSYNIHTKSRRITFPLITNETRFQTSGHKESISKAVWVVHYLSRVIYLFICVDVCICVYVGDDINVVSV